LNTFSPRYFTFYCLIFFVIQPHFRRSVECCPHSKLYVVLLLGTIK
jgi:hypothetical protein